MATERTFIAAKPDAVQRGLVGEIISRFEKRGYKLIALKLIHPDEKLLSEHYKEHIGKPFFPSLMSYMSSGPVCAMVWEGLEVVKTARSMLGATNPLDSNPGTIRGDFSIHKGRNVVHGSDAVESANREISIWFTPEEQMKWDRAVEPWIYE